MKNTCLFLSMMLLLSCSFNDGKYTSRGFTFSSRNFSEYYSSSTEGEITFYSDYDSKHVAFYLPEIEDGYYKCAVSEPKIPGLLPGTAIEMTYKGKTIKLLITDLNPYKPSSKWTNNENYYFDLGENAFEALTGNKSLGHVTVSFKAIPYETDKDLMLYAKDGINEWWLAVKFYNSKYPVTKVEYSHDGINFSKMEKMSYGSWYKASGSNMLSDIYFKVTDVYGNSIITKKIASIEKHGIYSTGKKF